MMRSKEASMGLRFLAALVSSGAAGAESHHTDHLVQEAMMMNELLRAQEEMRMKPVIDGFKGAEVAERIGRKLARGQVKEAAGFMPALSNLLKKAPVTSVPGTSIASAGSAALKSVAGIPTPKAAGGLLGGKPLIGWKGKAAIAGGLAAAGTGYAGYKGLQTAKDYMMMPSAGASQNWGGGGPQPMAGVNQYGYPQ